MSRRMLAASWIVPVALALVAPAAAQNFAGTVDRDLRVDWAVTQHPDGQLVAGQFLNASPYPITNTRLLVESVDGGGRIVATTITLLVGDLNPDMRRFFAVRVPAGAASHRVRLLSYDRIEGSSIP